jgi:hypothetical protein
VLVESKGRPVNVYRALGIRSCGVVAWKCAANHIERFRRHGYVIHGAHDGTYTYVGMARRGNADASPLRRRSR